MQALVVFGLFVSSFAFAIPEAQLSSRFQAEILPWFQSEMIRSEFVGTDRIKIAYFSRKISGSQCVLVMSPGQGEASIRYAELFFDLKDTGCDLYSIDHRGQGTSQRLLIDPQISHVQKFSDYVQDLSILVHEIVHPWNYRTSVLLAQSMGGAIATGFLRESPKDFSKVILSAPMLKINTGKYSQAQAKILARALILAGRGEKYAPGQVAYNPQRKFENASTKSRARFQTLVELENSKPEIQTGGTSVRWVSESMIFIEALRATKNLYQVPTKIYQADEDVVVMPEGQTQACAASPGFCSIIKVPNSRHGLLLEQDPARDTLMKEIRESLKH